MHKGLFMLTILHTESSTGLGGQEIRTLQECIGMLSRNYRVIIAAPEKSEIYRRAKSAGIDTYQTIFVKKNPLSITRVASLINREKVDVLNTHSSIDSWVATFGAILSRKKPLLIRTRHLSTPISKSFLSRFIYDIMPDAVITTGEEIRQRMIKLNNFNSKKIFSIPTGVDLELFDPAQTLPSIEKKGFTVGMVSVLRSWKGHEYFVRAVPEILKSIPESIFLIVGLGPRYEHIRNLIKEMSLEENVFMLGHREDIPEVMASFDVLVHPSYAHEGVPQSVLQALAMKRAVVASDSGAIKEAIINGKTGFLIKPKTPSLISQKVIQLYHSPDLRKKFGEEGRKIVKENYSFSNMLERIEELYRHLLIKRGK